VDGRPVFAAFQTNLDCPFFRDVPVRSTFAEEGRLRAACTAFINGIVLPAARRIPVSALTARTGLTSVERDVDRTYTVYRRDYATFAANLTAMLAEVDLRQACGIDCIRFYVCRHGLRLEKSRARALLDAVVDVDHHHVDLLQVHRADTLSFKDDDDDDGSALLVKLDGRDERSLLSVFRGGVAITSRTDRYRTGYLYRYGYFDRHASIPREDNLVTYVQAYNSAAKMARPRDCGLAPAYAFCRGSRGADRRPLETRRAIRQYLRVLSTYIDEYVSKRFQLRIEEVVTLDYRRLSCSMSRAL